MHIHRNRNQQSMVNQMKRILIIFLVVILIYMIGCLLVIKWGSSNALKEVNQMAELYISELDNQFLIISRNIFATVAEQDMQDSDFWEYVNMIKNDENYSYPVEKLRKMFFSSAWEYGTEYHMFLYVEQKDELLQLSMDSEGSYETLENLHETLVNQIENIDDIYHIKKKWNAVTHGEEKYICKIAEKDGIYLGCIVNVKDILFPFSQITEGKNESVSLINNQGECIGKITSEGIQEENEKEYKSSWGVIRKELTQAPFTIEMEVSEEHVVQILVNSIIVLVGVAGILFFASGFILYSLRKNILNPLLDFTQRLEEYEEDAETSEQVESRLLELEKIDNKFTYMIRQIRKLKISLYEQELEKQKIEMDYLKLQIRPHFYLNCLNFIYSMIDFKQYENAKKMSKITADYLSYIFRNTNEMVSAAAEVTHCKDYLEILLLRYPDNFEYYTEVHEEVCDAGMFPFLIQVFIENAAKHALTLEEKILISVTVYPEDRKEGKYVNIYISDTGKGFPDEFLEKLNRGESISNGGKHIGITNCLKRFQYYYGDKGKINFENSPLGGAVIDIHIPYNQINYNGE